MRRTPPLAGRAAPGPVTHQPAPELSTGLDPGVVVAAGPAIAATMIRTKRLTERAITFALAERDEDLAVARLAFLAQGDHAALGKAIDDCLARSDRTLYSRWRASA